MKDPETQTNVIDKVHKREDIYRGKFFDKAPDLVIEPKPGYDLKGAFNKDTTFAKGNFSGMHTYDDAFVYINNKNIIKNPLEIVDVTTTILNSLDIPVPEDIDGINFVKWN